MSNKDIMSLMGCTRQNIAKLLNELEKSNLIKRIGKTKSRSIYLNPYIIDAGCEVQKKFMICLNNNYKNGDDSY